MSGRTTEEKKVSNIISINIRRIRKKSGLTQALLASRAGISRNAYRSIETGASEPRASTLKSIAEALEVSVFDLTAEIPKLDALRFRSLSSYSAAERAEREQIKIDVASWLKDYNDLEALLSERILYAFWDSDMPPEPRKAADRAREILEISGEECVPDLSSLLEDAGIKILLIESGLRKFFGLSVGPRDGGPAIVVNKDEKIPVERRIFTAAHELGHLLLHMDSYDSDEDEGDELQEEEASVFASHFLMPQGQFEKVWNEGRGLSWVDNVLHTKRRFRVSYKTVLRRLIDEGGADDRIYRAFSQKYENRYGKRLAFKEEPESYVANRDEPKVLDNIDFIEDRLSGLVRGALERDLISVSRAAEILGISQAKMRERVGEWKMLE